MKYHILPLFIFALFTSLAACKKKNNDPDPISLKEKNTALLVDGTWNLAFNGDDVNNDGLYDSTDMNENWLAECMLDDTFTFNADSTYFIGPGTEFNGCTDQPIPGTWSLSEDGTTIYQDDYSGPIDSLSSTYLHYRLQFPDNVVHRILTK